MQLKSGSRLIVTDEIKREIQNNNGRLTSIEEIGKLSRDHRIISVGDVTTSNLRNAGIIPLLEVVDLKTKRGEKIYPHEEGSIEIKNEPGTISADLIIAIRNAISKGTRTRIEVDGEEDLAVLPIIYYSLCNTVIVYGIPDMGIAMLIVDSDLKKNAEKMLENMPVVNE